MFLEVSTTVGCGMECDYCPQQVIGSRYHGPRRMTVETFAACLDNCPAGIEVAFAGFAEPYLNRDCSAMIAMASARGSSVLVYTTGIGMNDADVELLIRVQPRILNLHLPDAGGRMKLPGGAVDGAYVHRLRKLVDAVSGCVAVCYDKLHPALAVHRWPLKTYPLHSRAGNVVSLGVVQARSRGAIRCRVATELDENVLLPDGALVLCCNDWSLRHPIGNLLTETWGAIRSGAKLVAVHEAMANDGDCLCQTCEMGERT